MMHSNPSQGNPPAGRATGPTDLNAAPLRNGVQQAVRSAVDGVPSSPTHAQQRAVLVEEVTARVLSALGQNGMPLSDPQHVHPSREPLPISPRTSFAPPLYAAPKPSRPNITTSPTSPTSPQIPTRYTPPSPNRNGTSSRTSSSPGPVQSDAGSDSSSDTRAGRRDSRASMSGQEDGTSSHHHKRSVSVSSSVEETILEKAWQPLFEDGKPTPRLSQFLRGLAMHIIEDCKPEGSIVVTPGKLSDFFKRTRVPHEMYPLTSLFGGRLRNQDISLIFKHLACQHHLVQLNLQDSPTIPGLTPQGFDAFMSLLILAHPDQEFQRLSIAVRDMPISNADRPSERFPKEFTRRLFPVSGDMHVQQRLTAALLSDPNVRPAQANSFPPPPPPPLAQPPSHMPSPRQVPGTERDRDRAPSQHDPGANSSVVEEEGTHTSGPILQERPRMPYVGRGGEGGGRIYDDQSGPIRPDTGVRPGRAHSAIPAQAAFSPPSRLADNTGGQRRHRLSMNGAPLPRQGPNPAHNVQNAYTRSEGTNVGDIPASQYASNMRAYEDGPQRRESRRIPRRQNTEEEMSRGQYSRGIPGQDYRNPAPADPNPHGRQAYPSQPPSSSRHYGD